MARARYVSGKRMVTKVKAEQNEERRHVSVEEKKEIKFGKGKGVGVEEKRRSKKR